MTEDQETDALLERLLRAAARVAANAPAKQGAYVGSAKIYWPYIHELRAALDAADIPWRKL